MDRPRSDAESIFLAALERTDRAGRAAFVAAACASDNPLRRRVEALSRAHEAAGSFLGCPPDAVDLWAADPTEAFDGRSAAGADTLTVLSRAYGEMPRVLLHDPSDGPETPVPAPPPATTARSVPHRALSPVR